MHKEIFTQGQLELLPLIKSFSDNFYLVGGTAIALHLGHRKSIDFDLFTSSKLNGRTIKSKIAAIKPTMLNAIYEDTEQMHFLVNGVKLTFFNFNYEIPSTENFEGIINLPNLLDLAAMKAFALGGRGKWKDYVDLYFILQNNYSLKQIAEKAHEFFSGQFNYKLFVQQLAYFKDLDYSEEVDYMPGYYVSQEEIKSYLVNEATKPF